LTFTSGVASEPADLYRTVLIVANGDTEVEQVKKTELSYLTSNKLTAPSTSYPVYYAEGDSIKIFPTSITSAKIDYIKKPSDPVWAYTGGGTSAYAYSSGSSTDFELHPSEEVMLVTKILAYAGVIINDPTVIQTAQVKEADTFTKENS
jgi:hypothetical protein